MMADLWGVLLGGILGWGGAAIQFFLQERKAEQERRTHRAQKFQELVKAVFEHEHWLELIKDQRLFGAKVEAGMSPMSMIQTLLAVYFPSLEKELDPLDMSARKYEMWMIDAAKKRIEGRNKEVSDGYQEAYQPYMRARSDFMKKLSAFAKQEFQ